jgi:hypothetical protein
MSIKIRHKATTAPSALDAGELAVRTANTLALFVGDGSAVQTLLGGPVAVGGADFATLRWNDTTKAWVTSSVLKTSTTGVTATGTLTSTGLATVDSLTCTNAASFGAATFGAEIVEAVGTVGSGATPELDPADGTIQTWTLTIEATPTEVLAAGEYITLLIDTPSYNVIWTNVDEWIGGGAPTLDTTETNVIEIWKVGAITYGALVGVAS